MAKQRYIKDSFWTDSYIERLTPDEKLTFLYLLTNPQNNIAGVYELRSKRMAFEMGYDIEVVETILSRFVRDNKILRIGEYVIIKNHIKHQSLGESTISGVNRIISELPSEIRKLFSLQEISNSKGEKYEVFSLFEEEIDTPYTPPIHPPILGVELSRVKLSVSKEEKKEILPSWLDLETWELWLKYNSEKKKPLTPTTIKLQLKKLELDKKNHKEIILQSIEKRWQGLFPISKQNKPDQTLKTNHSNTILEAMKKQSNEK